MPERLATALERAHRSDTLTRLELGALTPVEARELLGGLVDDDARATLLYEESGGNPFYLEQLARSSTAKPELREPVTCPRPRWASRRLSPPR